MQHTKHNSIQRAAAGIPCGMCVFVCARTFMSHGMLEIHCKIFARLLPRRRSSGTNCSISAEASRLAWPNVCQKFGWDGRNYFQEILPANAPFVGEIQPFRTLNQSRRNLGGVDSLCRFPPPNPSESRKDPESPHLVHNFTLHNFWDCAVSFFHGKLDPPT